MMVEDLRRVAGLLKKNIVTRNEYHEYGKFCADTLMWRFGSWNKAVTAAGLDTSANRRVTNDELLENIALVWMQLGRQPKCDEMKRPLSKYSYSTYDSHFGSWTYSLKAFEQFVKSGGVKQALKRSQAKPKPVIPEGCERAVMPKPKRDITYHIRYRVLKRDNYTCMKCKRSPVTHKGLELEVDHIKPWSKTYDSSLRNLQTLCKQCNVRKGNK